MTLIDKLEEKAINWQPIANLLSTSSLVVLLLGSMVQCTRINGLEGQLNEISASPVVVQFGRDKNAVLTSAVPKKDSMKEFVKELMPLLYASTTEISPEMQKECKPNCEKLAKGYDIEGIGTVPTMTALASNALAEEFQIPFLQNTVSQLPENFEQGGARLLSVKAVSDAVPLENRPKEYQLYVVGSLYAYDPQKNPLYGVEQDFKVSIREIAPPKVQEKLTSLQARIAATRARGFEITMIEPVAKKRSLGEDS